MVWKDEGDLDAWHGFGICIGGFWGFVREWIWGPNVGDRWGGDVEGWNCRDIGWWFILWFSWEIEDGEEVNVVALGIGQAGTGGLA